MGQNVLQAEGKSEKHKGKKTQKELNMYMNLNGHCL